MEKITIDGHNLLQLEVSFDKNIDVREVFEPMWRSQCRQGSIAIAQMFAGLDGCRAGFNEMFKTDEEFLNASRHEQATFFRIMEKITKSTLADHDFFVANGMSFFTLWAVAGVKGQIENKQYIEGEILKLRHEYNL